MPLIKFCPKCGSRMVLKKEGKKNVYYCEKCGYSEPARDVKLVITKGKEKAKIKVLDEKNEALKPLPITNVTCPKCGYDKAYWWIVQTRGADESPTQFFRCVRCGYTWREYS